MSSTVKKKGNSRINKEDEQHITSCTDDMKNLHMTYTEITCTKEVGICACCGKEGSGMNACNKCQMVKYCNASCKKKHRSKHKKKCERRVAELFDIELFKQPPKKEDCPICMLPLPWLDTGSKYKSCCGKVICSGCIHAVRLRSNMVSLCPFCRAPAPTSKKEILKQTKKRIEVGDAEAMFNLGCDYSIGECGLQRDRTKALESWHQAGELGYAGAYYNIGGAYKYGTGVERDEKKADHYYKLAAMHGSVYARHNLACSEHRAGNWKRAVKHYMIAAGAGYNNSVKNIQQLYLDGNATKEDYTKALLAYQAYLEDVRSEQRDQATAYNDSYKYI